MKEQHKVKTPASVHDIPVRQSNGEEIYLSQYAGNVLLIVNSASFCGFTHQYRGLRELQDLYRDQPFQVLAFPSDNFMNQEYGSDEQIQQFCETNYSLNFPVFSKINVKGANKHPLFQYLTEKSQNGKFNATPKWNFTKYLIDKAGKVRNFYHPITKPTAKRITQKIDQLL
jgi:glutathione peroxidase